MDALVPCEVFGARTLLFWRGPMPLWYGNPVEKRALAGRQANEAGSESAGTKVYATLTFLRGTLNVETLVKDACQAMNRASWSVENAEEQAKNRFVIHFVPRREEICYKPRNLSIVICLMLFSRLQTV